MQRTIIILSALLMISSVGAVSHRFIGSNNKLRSSNNVNTLQVFSALTDGTSVSVQTVFNTNATTTFAQVNASSASPLSAVLENGIATVNFFAFGTTTVVATTTLNFTGSSPFTVGLFGTGAPGGATAVTYTDDNTPPAISFGRVRVINGVSGESLLVLINGQEAFGNGTIAFHDATPYFTTSNGNTFISAVASVQNATVLISDLNLANGAVNTVVAIPGVNNTLSSIIVTAVAGTTPITLPGGTTAPGAAASIFPTPVAVLVALLFVILSLL